ncbi:MAG: ATP-binding cassette domain-containing protein [Methanomicrobiaceae archaeon]|nr:ATP-binding cassette domain-containing protein [Methanomicrobiaceae archaeon]
MIEAENITKVYGEMEVLHGVDLSVGEEDILGIIGPSGSGKSTFLRVLDLIEPPDAGELSIFDVDVVKHSDRVVELRRRMGMLFQKPIVFNTSVHENVAMGLKYRHVSKDEIDRSVKEMLEAVGLARYIRSNARNLSGGEQQRVSLARVLVTEPEILFLDEPTANLDPKSAETIERLVMRMNRDRGMTVVMNTHDMLQGQRVAKRIGVMIGGDILQVGSPREIFYAPNSTRIANFVGVDNIHDGKVLGREHGITSVEVAGTTLYVGESPPKQRDRVKVIFRGEDVTIGVGETAQTSARNVLNGTIAEVSDVAPFVYVKVDCGFPVSALVTMRSAEEMALEEGTQVWASIKASTLHLIAESEESEG